MAQELRFDGKVAIITGAGAGMGREHALLLGSRGATVIINDLQAEMAETTRADVEKAGGKAVAVVGSVAERSVLEAMVDMAISKFGRIDILINNAGIEIKKVFDEFTETDFSRMMGVHVFGSWMLSQLVWPHMKKQKYGRILIVSSTSLFGMHSNAAYVTAKGALFGLGKSLATEGPEHGILVNLLGPSAATAMAKQMVGENEEVFTWMSKTLPASTTSPVAAWLVHEDCKTNGEFITTYGRSAGKIIFGETKGSYCPDGDYTIETVRDHFDETCKLEGFIMPKSVHEQSSTLVGMRLAGDGAATNAIFESM